MLKAFLSLLTCLFILGAAPAIAAPMVGEAAPDFEVTDIDGNTVKLSSFRGQPVVLEWTDAACPCVGRHYKTGNMQKLQKQAGENGAIWLTISSTAAGNPGHMSTDQAKARRDETGSVSKAWILDESGEIGRAFGAKTTPHMFVVDAEGTLVYSGAIDSDPSYEVDPAQSENYVMAALQSLSAGEPVATPETQPYGCGVKY